MPRILTVKCENCGCEAPRLPERPKTWWSLEETFVEVLRTGPLDFCSLSCLVAWTRDPRVQGALAADFSRDALVRAAEGARLT